MILHLQISFYSTINLKVTYLRYLKYHKINLNSSTNSKGIVFMGGCIIITGSLAFQNCLGLTIKKLEILKLTTAKLNILRIEGLIIGRGRGLYSESFSTVIKMQM